MNRLATSFLPLMLLTISSIQAEGIEIISPPNNGQVPDAEIDAKGTVHVAYVVGENAFYAKSDDGKTFTDPLRINSEPGTVHPPHTFRGPDLAIGKDGRVHAVWYVNAYQRKLPKDQWGVFYSYLDPGKAGFAPARNLNQKPSDNYSLAADAEGNVAVIWMAGSLYVTSSRDNGKTFGAAETVNIADPCECCASRAFFSPESTLSILYREKARNIRDMHLLERTKGQPVFTLQKISSTPWEVNACPMTGAFLTGAKQDRIAAFETKGQISYARLAPARSLAPSTEVKVAPQGKWPVALGAPDGTILVSWKNGGRLYWHLRDPNDKPLGKTQSRPSTNPHRHAGVLTRGGNFLLID